MIYNAVDLVSLYSPGILRLGIWLFVIERLFATQLRKTYEKKKSSIIATIFFIAPFGYELALYFCIQAWSSFEFYYFTLCILIDFIILILILSLLYLNVKLKKLTFQNNVELSEKFQINENIRLIKLMIPLVFSFIFINIIFNSLIDYGSLKFISKDDLLALNVTILFMAYNIFLVYLLIKFKKINDTKVGCLNSNSKRNELTDTANNSQNNPKINTIAGSVKIFNGDGKKIPTHYDQKSYFEMFAKSWNT
uniref:7TM_GPCR_Srx domain-containing protein n=1 Tax=Strongyloides papillosus TaxID=174720 RepID=A0A0N5BJD5_STREA